MFKYLILLFLFPSYISADTYVDKGTIVYQLKNGGEVSVAGYLSNSFYCDVVKYYTNNYSLIQFTIGNTDIQYIVKNKDIKDTDNILGKRTETKIKIDENEYNYLIMPGTKYLQYVNDNLIENSYSGWYNITPCKIVQNIDKSTCIIKIRTGSMYIVKRNNLRKVQND